MKLTIKQKSTAEKRIQVVDLVRAFSIVIVLATHLGLIYISKPPQSYFLDYFWYRFMYNGGFGVTVFFVVSGFVITRLIASQSGGLFNPNFKDFYIRRVARIFPLLILVCLLGIITLFLFPNQSQAFKYIIKDPDTPMTPAFWISIFSFTFNWYLIFSTFLHEKIHHMGVFWGVLWSLSIEEQFYLFYPFTLKFLRNKQNLVFFLSAIIIFGIFSPIILGYFSSDLVFLDKNSFRNFSFIAFGCLLYLISNQYEEILSKNKKACVSLCLFGIFIFWIFYWHHYVDINYYIFFWGTPSFERWISTFLAFGVFLFLLGGLHLEFFNSKYWCIFSRIGKLSYGGYLYHAFILYLLWPFFSGKNVYLNFFIFVVLTLGLAELSYRYFEVPSNLWIRKNLSRNK